MLTLNYDILSVVVKECVCEKCGFYHRYSGELNGIYPVERHCGFTVQLMYY